MNRRLLCLGLLAATHVAHAQTMSHDMAGMSDMSAMSMPSPAAQDLPPNSHVPPPPPTHVMNTMAMHDENDATDMHTNGTRSMLLIDRLEWGRSGGDGALSWEGEGWWGTDIDRLWLRSEGERDARSTQDAYVEGFWSHAFATYWDAQLGMRQDIGTGPHRQWLAVGLQGLAPYWFETQGTFYASDHGNTALRFESKYDLLLTQRLIFTPKVEVNLYGRDDPQEGIRAGFSQAEAGVRLRYEISRRFAPYIGVSIAYRRLPDGRYPILNQVTAHETTWLAGFRFWF